MVAPANDWVVSTSSSKSILQQLNAPTQAVVLPKKKGVRHQSFIKTHLDTCLNVRKNCWEAFDFAAVIASLDLFYEKYVTP